MEQKRKHRGVLRSMFTKNHAELEKHLDAVATDSIKVSWELLQNKFDKLKVADNEIYNLMLEKDATEEELLAEMESVEVYAEKFVTASGRCQKLIEGNYQQSVMPEGNPAGMRRFRLPIIEFKTFKGEIKDWLPFWSQFQKVHDDPNIDLNDKVEYLIQATVPGSRARNLVESFPATGKNYEKMIESLMSRFGRKDLQVEVYVRELLKLVVHNAIDGSKMDLAMLYDKIETQLRALETLDITSDKCAAMIFPLIESCVPQDLLRVWQRSSHQDATSLTTAVSGLEKRLASLMSFLKQEVENDQRTILAAEGFGLRPTGRDKISTATGLVNHGAEKCVFCGNTHESASCFKAQKFTMEKKKEILSEKKACYRCLRIGHQSRQCKARLRCLVCSQSHVPLMCPDLPKGNRVIEKSRLTKDDKTHDTAVSETLTCTNSTNTHVFLQTLRVKLCGASTSRNVRALIDTGSQNTYILKSTALALGYPSKRKEKIIHCLFGGATSQENHDCYDVTVSHMNYKCSFEAFSQSVICTDIAPVFDGPWMQELNRLGVHVTDKYDPAPIELLIGSDIAGRLYTGKRHILTSGLVAVETLCGWTLMGRIPLNTSRSTTMTSISLFVKDASITQLWQLDVLGITEPTEQKSRLELVSSAKNFFKETVRTNEEGRYEVNLPWLEGHPPLPNNYAEAKRRLAHYLPHRAVVKESSATTKIRPVFDASAKAKNGTSLNQCLETGPNLIELIPTMLYRFRQNKLGVTADIRKAFLQISLHKGDRDFLRFLWKGPGDEIITYRHKRVVFGISSSPFLLGATLEHHISKSLDKCNCGKVSYSSETASRLARSFYVDNCVASVPTEQTLKCFIEESKMIMEEAKFDLRGWEFTQQICSPDYTHTPLLGLEWDKRVDTLKINTDFLKDLDKTLQEPITKRVMLSLAQRVFDPIGFTCPVTLLPKLLLQKTWEMKIGWDASVDLEIEEAFRGWVKELSQLQTIAIPRWVRLGPGEAKQLSIHTFCDASQNAYAAVVFLRGIYDDKVFIRLLAAKSRISPLKKITIPRLELLAAVIGARLYGSVKEALALEVKSYFWSDSTTVISWIHRNEEWGTFVHNRVAEIRRTTPSNLWRFVSGILNPADLPSRGCGAKFLLHSRWWEGPHWLYDDPNSWPGHENMQYDELQINKEKRKKIASSLFNRSDSMNEDDWHLTYFSKYLKSLRMIAWIFRFLFNARNPNNKRKGELTEEEIGKAETFVVKQVQRVSLDENDKRWRNLQSFRDENGVIRVKSRVLRRNDEEHFRLPILLPANHPVVTKLIFDAHVRACHVGTQGLTSILRNDYWILGGRRPVRSAIAKCVVCKRHNGKPFETDNAPLPFDRVRDARVFEITGVDFAGPLFLKTGEKAWICLYTCAIYRAVHLELCTSLTVAGFVQTLRRFIARRGRPSTIYSDNGTNFVGTENAFEKIDWQKIAEYSSAERITWHFNPPSAPWWGGFWERLIGVLKQLLRKVLGRACLSYEELLTVLCDCESVINSRPLTYMSNDSGELLHLTPNSFLHEQAYCGVPDCDEVDSQSFCRKVAYQRKLREDLRRRFRDEYLGQLHLLQKKHYDRPITVGELVLIGNDNDKRLAWPLGRITELMPGPDGQIRLVRVTTARGQLLRPVQRIYPLECASATENAVTRVTNQEGNTYETSTSPETTNIEGDDGEEVVREPVRENARMCKSREPEAKVSVTRSGRLTRIPNRLQY